MSNIEIPDFEDLYALATKIKNLNLEKMALENKIKYEESKVMIEARTSQRYFENGKPPAISFIEATYLFTGFDDSILPYRERLAEVSADLEHSRMLFQLSKDKIDVWRTQSANERNTVL